MSKRRHSVARALPPLLAAGVLAALALGGCGQKGPLTLPAPPAPARAPAAAPPPAANAPAQPTPAAPAASSPARTP